MNWVYLDTSAFLKLFLDEPRADEAWEAMKGASFLFASRLVLTEARISLARYEQAKRLTSEEYKAALKSVDTFWDTDIESLEVSEDVLKEAERQAAFTPLKTLDAIHLATAKLARKNLPQRAAVGFLTFDGRLRTHALATRFLDPLA